MKIYFNTTVFLTLLISKTISKTIYNTKTAADENRINLNTFMNLLHNAQIDLKWIRDTNQLYRGKKYTSNWLSTPDLNFISLGDNQNSADKWYKQFRDDEIKLNPPVKSVEVNAEPNHSEQADVAINLPATDNAVVDDRKLQDQAETTKNDLSHEANYKLSKYEQEREEKNRVDQEKQIEGLLRGAASSGVFLNKRKIDPAEEIRLKIRGRVADRYETFVERHLEPANFTGQDYDGYMRTHRKIPNYNLFKREIPEADRPFTNRKLLQYDYEADNDKQADSFPDFSYDNDDRNEMQFGEHRDKRQKKSPTGTNDLMAGDMVTGLLPNKLVKAIFTLAQKNDNFHKHIVPNVKIKSFVELKKSDIQAQNAKSSDNIAKKSNEMIGNIVKSITQLVDTQVKVRSCIPINADQQKFLNKLRSARKNAKTMKAKLDFPIFSKQQEQNMAIDEEIDTNRYVRSPAQNIDGKIINDKYTIITNLQNSFNKLTSTDQARYNTMKEFIDKHLSLLDELSEISRQNDQLVQTDAAALSQPVKRETFGEDSDEEFNPDLNTIEIKQPVNDQMSQRFIKLSKMVEFMRQNSLLDTTNYDFIGNDFIL